MHSNMRVQRNKTVIFSVDHAPMRADSHLLAVINLSQFEGRLLCFLLSVSERSMYARKQV